MKRLGIFGGAFDPPHIAHSIIAEDVREQLHLDKIIFIPSGNPPLKDAQGVTPAVHRMEMSKISFGSDPNFEVSDIEFSNSDERSFTVDTLMKLHEIYPKNTVKFYLIIGIDNLIDFPKWKNPEKLFLLSEVIIANRPNYLIDNVPGEYMQKVKFLNVPNLDISSSGIRKRVSQGKSIKYLVHPDVEKYILHNKLYNPS
jgi:nicotinate-nucleotide adenylyltransferase